MAGKTLDEIKAFVNETVIRELYLGDDGYPWIFLGEELLAWAEYADFSEFDAFEILGFRRIRYNVEFGKQFFKEGSQEWEVSDIISTELSFTETLKAIQDLSIHLQIKEYPEAEIEE